MVKRVANARFPNTNLKTSNYCIAYLDILGGTNMIRKDENNEHLNIINMIYHDAIEESKMFTKSSKQSIVVKIFSDNLLLAIPTDNKDRKQNIEKIIGLTNNIIEEALDYGYLIRGAITEGSFFCNNIFVYGKALLDVVEMEEKYAIYPRVIVAKEIVELLPQYFYPCADGWNMFNNFIIPTNSFQHLNFKETLLKQLNMNNCDKKVVQKIMWAITWFNEYNSIIKQFGSSNYLFITDEEIANATK